MRPPELEEIDRRFELINKGKQYGEPHQPASQVPLSQPGSGAGSVMGKTTAGAQPVPQTQSWVDVLMNTISENTGAAADFIRSYFGDEETLPPVNVPQGTYEEGSQMDRDAGNAVVDEILGTDQRMESIPPVPDRAPEATPPQPPGFSVAPVKGSGTVDTSVEPGPEASSENKAEAKTKPSDNATDGGATKGSPKVRNPVSANAQAKSKRASVANTLANDMLEDDKFGFQAAIERGFGRLPGMTSVGMRGFK